MKGYWKSLAYSAIGTLHKKENIPCQDAGGVLVAGKVILGVVADGAGSAKFSDESSKLVVETTKVELLNALGNLYVQTFLGFEPGWNERKAKKVFTKVLKTNVKVLARRAKELNCSIDELATTIIAFVATPFWIAACQIGDGFLVYRPKKSAEYLLVFHPNKGEYANETLFITIPGVESSLQVKVIKNQTEFICASTDGLENIAIVKTEKKPFSSFFKAIENNFRNDECNSNNWIKQWLESDPKLNQKTNDDKTLVIGVK